jgi:hypothetical protein
MARAGRTAVVATLLMAAINVAATAPAAAASDREINQAQQFREAFGLPASMEVVRDSFSDPGTYSNVSNGVPLKPSEAAELKRRDGVFAASLPAIAFAKTLDGYAEMHLDQLRGGIPVFFYTSDVEARRQAIGRHLPDSVDFDVQKVDYTTKQLRAKQTEVTNDMVATDWVLGGDIPIAQVADGVVQNRVMVGLLRRADEDAARKILLDRYGPMVDVEYIGPSENDTCVGRDECRDPLKGGLRIGREGLFRCTTGFNGTRNGDSVMFTAGHCLTENGGTGCGSPFIDWKHNGSQFGCAQGETLPSGGGSADADVGWIKIDDDEDGTPRNKVFAEDQNDIRPVVDVLSGEDLEIDERLCRSGGASDWDCGPLVNKCVDKPNGEGWTILCVASVAYDSTAGDSGAPYTRGLGSGEVAAAGIHVHSSDDDCTTMCRSWFTKANRVENESGGSICTTSGC